MSMRASSPFDLSRPCLPAGWHGRRRPRRRRWPGWYRSPVLAPTCSKRAVAHDRDAVAHGQRFFLVVGHIDEGNLQFLLVAADLHLHLGRAVRGRDWRAARRAAAGPGARSGRAPGPRAAAGRRKARWDSGLPALPAAAAAIAQRSRSSRWALARSACAAGNTMFSATVLWGKSRKFWNTMPMWRR